MAARTIKVIGICSLGLMWEHDTDSTPTPSLFSESCSGESHLPPLEFIPLLGLIIAFLALNWDHMSVRIGKISPFLKEKVNWCFRTFAEARRVGIALRKHQVLLLIQVPGYHILPFFFESQSALMGTYFHHILSFPATFKSWILPKEAIQQLLPLPTNTYIYSGRSVFPLT